MTSYAFSSFSESTGSPLNVNATISNYWGSDPNATTWFPTSNLTTPANSSNSSTSWLSTTNPYCSYVCVYNTTTGPPNTTTVRVETIVPVAYADYYIGVILAIAQTFFGGFSFLFKKIGQNRIAADERKRADKRRGASTNSRAPIADHQTDPSAEGRGDGAATGADSNGTAGDSGTTGPAESGSNSEVGGNAGAGRTPSAGNFRYLLDYVWWLGMIFMAVAEIMNFVAYIFAPATVVTPLGALQIVTSAVIAWIFLKEHLNVFGQVGCVLAIIGTTLIVVFAPKEDELQTMEQLAGQCLDAVWLVYCGLVVVLNLFLIFYANPKWGRKVVFVPITVNASIGSITVMSARGIGFTYVILAIMVAALLIQIIYLNMAIGQFNINIVAPVLYVEFTSLSITASAILFKELSNLAYTNIVALVLGFLVIIVGLFLVSSFKDLKFGWRNWFRFLFCRADQSDAAAGEEAASTEVHSEVHSENEDSGSGSNGAPSQAVAAQTHGAAPGGANSDALTQRDNGDLADGPIAPADPIYAVAAAVNPATGTTAGHLFDTDEPRNKRKKSVRLRDVSVKNSIKKTWYRIAELNRFGSHRRRGVKRLVSTQSSDAQNTNGSGGGEQTFDANPAIQKSNTLESGIYDNDGNGIDDQSASAEEEVRDQVFTDIDVVPPAVASSGEQDVRTSEDLSTGELGASSASIAQLLHRSEPRDDLRAQASPVPPFATGSRFGVAASPASDAPSESSQRHNGLSAPALSPSQPVLYSRRPTAAVGQQQLRRRDSKSKVGSPLTPESHTNPFLALSERQTPKSPSSPQVAINLETIANLPPPPVLSREPSRVRLSYSGSSGSPDIGTSTSGKSGIERARPRHSLHTSVRSTNPQLQSSSKKTNAEHVSTATSQAASDPIRLTAYKRVDFV